VTVEAVFRREYGCCVATLIRFLGDIDAAEEAVQDAKDDALAPAGETVPDDRLRLIFTCRHPALNRQAQVALTLRLLGGLASLGRPHPARERTGGSPPGGQHPEGETLNQPATTHSSARTRAG
jgi:predicted RNA polymerase sigma factor